MEEIVNIHFEPFAFNSFTIIEAKEIMNLPHHFFGGGVCIIPVNTMVKAVRVQFAFVAKFGDLQTSLNIEYTVADADDVRPHILNHHHTLGVMRCFRYSTCHWFDVLATPIAHQLFSISLVYLLHHQWRAIVML